MGAELTRALGRPLHTSHSITSAHDYTERTPVPSAHRSWHRSRCNDVGESRLWPSQYGNSVSGRRQATSTPWAKRPAAISQYASSISTPMARRPASFAATKVDPLPAKRSRITSPGFVE